MALRVVIADDHAAFRQTLRLILAGVEGVSIIGECADGAAALEMIRAERPDVAILDLAMPGLDGISVARAVQKEPVACSVFLLTMYVDAELRNQALRAGVRAYIHKEDTVAELISALHAWK